VGKWQFASTPYTTRGRAERRGYKGEGNDKVNDAERTSRPDLGIGAGRDVPTPIRNRGRANDKAGGRRLKPAATGGKKRRACEGWGCPILFPQDDCIG